MVNANGQVMPAETVQAMGADAARAVLAMGLTADQLATVIGQVRESRNFLAPQVSPWHEGFLDVVADQAINGPVLTCPACSADGVLSDDPLVLKCTGCGGFFTNPKEPIPMQAALHFVNLLAPMQANAGADGQFMFDLDILDGSQAPAARRFHGWADARTKRVVQWG